MKWVPHRKWVHAEIKNHHRGGVYTQFTKKLSSILLFGHQCKGYFGAYVDSDRGNFMIFFSFVWLVSAAPPLKLISKERLAAECTDSGLSFDTQHAVIGDEKMWQTSEVIVRRTDWRHVFRRHACATALFLRCPVNSGYYQCSGQPVRGSNSRYEVAGRIMVPSPTFNSLQWRHIIRS